jgi:predicted dithiol-disulfide oxidoreductase (DUF899 family)
LKSILRLEIQQTRPHLNKPAHYLSLYVRSAWKEGCPHCSFWADHYDSVNIHLGQRDTTFAVVSRAPLKEIEPFKKRMGWRFKWRRR